MCCLIPLELGIFGTIVQNEMLRESKLNSHRRAGPAVFCPIALRRRRRNAKIKYLKATRQEASCPHLARVEKFYDDKISSRKGGSDSAWRYGRTGRIARRRGFLRSLIPAADIDGSHGRTPVASVFRIYPPTRGTMVKCELRPRSIILGAPDVFTIVNLDRVRMRADDIQRMYAGAS
jgi:hypothetical protein